MNRLWLTDFRNLRSLDFSTDHEANLIYGPNGSGKTSFLEAIYILGTGSSFRTASLDQAITFEQPQMGLGCTTTTGQRLTFQKQRNQQPVVRIDNSPAKSGSALARAMPVLAIHPESYLLASGIPDLRRRHLDGLAFHVEPSFHKTWREYKRALRQRNAQLRQGTDSALSHWEDAMVKTAKQLTGYREHCLALLQEKVVDTLLQAGFDKNLTRFAQGIGLRFTPGWPKNTELQAALSKSLLSDKQLGYTRWGAHRADITVTIGGEDIRGRISRAEQRILSVVLILAQARVLIDLGLCVPVLLLDDVLAELDEKNLQVLIKLIFSLGMRSFWTLPNKQLEAKFSGLNYQMFHVKHLLERG